MWHEIKDWACTFTDRTDLTECIDMLERYGWIEDCPTETRWVWVRNNARCELTHADRTFRFYIKEVQL